MIIVVAVIAMLLSLIVPNLTKKQQMISDKGCQALKETVNSQVYLYFVDQGKYPNNINQLVSKNYLNREQTTCDNDQKIILKDNQAYITK